MTPPTLHSVLKALNLPLDWHESFERDWSTSCQTLPAETPSFLCPEAVRHHRSFCSLDDHLEPLLIEIAQRVVDLPPLKLLVWHLYRRLFHSTEKVAFDRCPPITVLGRDRGLFYLLLAQSMVPLVRAAHAAAGIEEQITRETCRQVACFMENHRTGCEGRPGILVQHLAWLRHYVAGRLFRLGRFEYMLTPVSNNMHLFRHRQDHTLLLLARPSLTLDDAGHALAPGGLNPGTTTSYDETEGHYTGHCVSPEGVAAKAPIPLDRRLWEPVFAPGDQWIDMHIPSGGGMTPAATIDSFRRAFQFFAKHHPSRPPIAIHCVSWIFNPQWITGLPLSNLAAVLQELYLYPVASPPGAGLEFVFCREYDDWSAAPRSTRLQRLMLDLNARGHGLRNGGMFFLRDQIEAFGTAVYRNHHGPRAARSKKGITLHGIT